ncbi:hypothetical protein [Alkanindiges illinoisensis]|uniref:hypothetical protein n=1 Tax=Alkanindiges illinoisensis TaxID=197183 RepID=UPI00047ABC91|nr:hypothetical protein [Alkanindiges illinoisensis]
MNIEMLTAKIAFGSVQLRNYSDWAESLLDQGNESENIMILASFGLDKNIDKYEIETYFEKCLSELKLKLPTREKALKIYAKQLCIELLQENILVKKAIDDLSRLWSLTDYEEPLFRIWDELSEDIYFIENEEHGAFWNSGLTKENQSTYIKEFAEQFLQLLELKLPENFWQLSYCESCKYIGKLTIETKIEWLPVTKFKFFKFSTEHLVNYAACAKCLTPYPLTMTDFTGRKKYLKMAKILTNNPL